MSKVLHNYYYKRYLFIILSVAFITSAVVGYTLIRTPNYVDVNVIDLVEIEESEIDLANAEKEDEEEDSNTVDFTLSGVVTDIAKDLDRPGVKIRISTKDAEGNAISKVVGLDYNNNFTLKDVKMLKGEIVRIIPESPEYVFFPAVEDLVVKKDQQKVTFKADLKDIVSDSLTVTGKVNSTGNVTGIVYLVGWTAKENNRVKEFTSLSSGGDFQFKDLKGGTYIIIPEVEDTVLLPDSKKVELLNKDIKVNFIGTKKLF